MLHKSVKSVSSVVNMKPRMIRTFLALLGVLEHSGRYIVNQPQTLPMRIVFWKSLRAILQPSVFSLAFALSQDSISTPSSTDSQPVIMALRWAVTV